MRAWGITILLFCTLLSCREPTQILVQLETDIPCSEIKAFSFATGLPSGVHAKGPSQIHQGNGSNFNCRRAPNSNVNILGTLTVIPEKSTTATVGIDAYLRFTGEALSSTGHACQIGAPGCIFQPIEGKINILRQ